MELLQTFLSEHTIQRIGWVLIHFLWQGVAAGALLWCVLKMLGKASSNTRYIAACAGLVLMVLAPAATFMMIGDDAPVAVVEPVSPSVAVSEVPMPAETRVITFDDASPEPIILPKPSLGETVTAYLEAALPYCVIGWFVGVAVLSVWYLGGWCQLQKLRRIGTKNVADKVRQASSEIASRLGIRRAVGIVESALVQVPTVIGWLKPVILLPATALTGLDEVQLRAMIAHELAHIKRCDYGVNIVQTVVEILGFYHPAVWWMSRRIRIERENCCDDMAVALLQNKKEYAGALFTMEAIRTKQHDLAVAANGGHLSNRITRLAGKPETHQKSGWIPSVLTLVTIIVLLGSTFAFNSASAKINENLTDAEGKSELNPEIPEQLILKIVDESGIPVPGAIVGTSVRTRDEDSDLYSKLSWSLRGSNSPHRPTSDENGIVTINPAKIILNWKTEPKAMVYVMHEGLKLGAMVGIFTDKLENEMTVTLKPLCHIYGKLINKEFEKQGYPLQWTNVYLRWKEQDPCEHMSEKQEFEFWVPPGQYELMAYGSGGKDKQHLFAPTTAKMWTIEVRDGQSELDLGEIDLPSTKLAALIGKQAPEIGPIKEWKNGSPVTLNELKGKPVVLYFDGDSPNTSRDLPELVILHEQFANQGLVIISLYNSPSLKALEQKWEEVYDKYGGVKDVPFRVAIDGDKSTKVDMNGKTYEISGATYGTYEIEGDPTVLLIDPQGSIVGEVGLHQINDILKENYGMASSVFQKPSTKLWEGAFNEVYQLEEGQILKRIAPPFIPERKDFYYEHDPDQAAAIPEPPDYFTFHWDGELGPWGMGFMGGGNTLDNVIRQSLSIPADQFEGPDEVLKFPVPGDWIVRKSTTDAEKLRALETILQQELGRPIKFQKREVKRLVIVAKGTYKFTPPQGTYDDRQVHFYSDKLDANEGSGGGTADTVHELISVLGQRTGLQVIDEITNSSQEINQPYGHHRSSRLRDIKGQGYQTDRLNQMLKNLEQQTNLTFTIEERIVSKWFIVGKTELPPAMRGGVGGGMMGGGFGGMRVAEPNEAINYPRNWDKILAEQNKKRGIDPNDYPPVGEINLSDPNQMLTEVYDVSDILSYNDTNRKPGENLEVLKQTVIQTIVPESWHENGGQGRLDLYSDGKLIIYQTPEVHETLRNRFEKFRDIFLKYQIAIEARILLITDSFLQDIGLDTSLPAGYETSGGVGQIVVGPANSKDILAALEHKTLEERGSKVQETVTPQSQPLDDLQMEFLLRATQAHRDAKQLTAPKVMVFNGESACIQIQKDVKYTDFDDAEKAVPAGLILDIKPIISADQQEVILNGHIQFSEVLENQTVESGGKHYEIPLMQAANIPIHRMIVKDRETITIAGPELKLSEPITERPPVTTRPSGYKPRVFGKQRLLILIKPTIIKQDEQ